VGITRRAPESEHRILFFRLEIGTCHKIRIFIGFEAARR
jgi:hypothetical protein